MVQRLYDRGWSYRGSNTECVLPNPNPERMVKSLHHHPGTRIQANHIHWRLRKLLGLVFEADLVLQQTGSSDSDETG